MFESGAATHVGKVRRRNEDSYLIRSDSGLWAVADGMGGHNDGDIASATLIEELATIGPTRSASELLARCEGGLIKANARLQVMSHERGGIIGATIAILLTYDPHYACVWAGDSRIYLVRAGEVQQLSRDHTEVQELIAEGVLTPDQARTWPRQNVVTRAIGVYEKPELEISYGVLEVGDVFVVCSDGLTTHVREEEILTHVSRRLSQDACDSLVELALERGAVDNVTVVVVRYRPDAGERSAFQAQSGGQ